MTTVKPKTHRTVRQDINKLKKDVNKLENKVTHKTPKRSDAQKLQDKKLQKFENWANGLDANKDGQITQAEVQARIDSRTAKDKAHPYASYLKDNFSKVDTNNTGKVSDTNAAAFLANNYKISSSQVNNFNTTG